MVGARIGAEHPRDTCARRRNRESGGNADAITIGNFDTNPAFVAHTESQPDSHANMDTDAEAQSKSNAEIQSDSNTNRHAKAEPESNADTAVHVTDANSDSDAENNINVDPDGNASPVADGYTNTRAIGFSVAE